MKKTGVIADDFTGAGDIASFFQKGGARTLLVTEVPAVFGEEWDCVVVALKTRSAEPEDAARQVKRALAFLKKAGMERIYFKYCSTFDSTPRGNIGVVLDALLDELKIPFTILCPSLPVNGRTVKDGILYVNGMPLAESPMKDHPLNPMWASSILELMRPQSRYPCFVLRREEIENGKVGEFIEECQKKCEKFYLIPDYEDEEDGRRIAETFGDCPLLSGGSGLAEYLSKGSVQPVTQTRERVKGQKAILLCGSCSQMSGRQIEFYCGKGHAAYCVDAQKLAEGSLRAEDIFAYALEHDDVLVYSSAAKEGLCSVERTESFYKRAKLMEALMADLSEMAVRAGFDRVIVAGGETSGAAALRLGYAVYQIGDSVAPGVPVMRPLENLGLSVILKSGNFGDEDFFEKALWEGGYEHG